MTSAPWFTIVAGPNGSGKSTLARTLLPNTPIINPDAIAREIDPGNPFAAAVAAGKEAIRRFHEKISSGDTFAAETTLSGNTPLAWMKHARSNGYQIELIYIGLRDTTIAHDRIAQRVALDGHAIPHADVERRYTRSLANLTDAIARADKATIYDNTKRPYRLLQIEAGTVQMARTSKPRWLTQALPGDLRIGTSPLQPPPFRGWSR